MWEKERERKRGYKIANLELQKKDDRKRWQKKVTKKMSQRLWLSEIVMEWWIGKAYS